MNYKKDHLMVAVGNHRTLVHAANRSGHLTVHLVREVTDHLRWVWVGEDR